MAAAGAEVVRTSADGMMSEAIARAEPDRARHSRRLPPQPVPQPRQSPGPLRDDRPRDRRAGRRPHRRLGRRRRNDRHVHGRRALPHRAAAGPPPRGRRAAGLDPFGRRAGAARRRGHRPLADLADPRSQPHRRSRSTIDDAEAFETCRALAREEGLFAGGSSGAAAAGALRIARRLGPGKTVVTLFPDGAERYPDQGIFQN